MKRPLFFLLAFLFAQALFAQTIQDALRYSYLNPGGSARFMGAGGAFGSLGADYGVLSTNPAGLALFRTDELVFTPGLRFAKSTGTLRGSGNEANEDTKTNFNVNNVGIIFHTEPRNPRWKTFNVGIGMNKMANFHDAQFYTGKSQGSIMNPWFADVVGASGVADNLDPFAARLGYDANAIYEQDGLLTYDFAGTQTATVQRSQSLLTTGSINEMVLSFAGNYDEKLMVGATIGVPFVSYKTEGSYDESDPTDAVLYFDRLTYTEFLRTNGIGVNLKMGLIYKVNRAIRVGAALHTPTLMSLTDNYSTTFQYDYTDGTGSKTGDVLSSPDGTFDYKLRTPWRAILSSSVVINKMGFLSADVEFVDYSANRFNLTANTANTDDQVAERDLNNSIRKSYQQALNVRLGGELAFGNFRARAGANLLGKPGEGKNGFNTAITGGIGVRGDAFYLDLGFRHLTGTSTVAAYSDPTPLVQQPIADFSSAINEVLMTVGFKF